MDLLMVVRHLDPQYLAGSVREAKSTCLGYGIQAKQAAHSRPPLALAFLRGSHLATQDPEQENNPGTPGRSQVPQADPPATRLHNSNQR
jgi:hypothetical protein